MKRWILIAVLIGLLALTSCKPNPTGDPSKSVYDENGYYKAISRYVDDEAGVVCWLYNAKGIFCLPIDQTRLK